MLKIYSSLFLFFGLWVLKAQSFPADTLQIMFVGDIMSHGPQRKAAYNPQTKTYDYTENFKYLKPYFQQADYVIGNLETTLGVLPYSGYPQFSAPPALAQACLDAGINVLATANNHACDKHMYGIIHTIDVLDSLHIQHFGTYRHQTAADRLSPLWLRKKGMRLALLNYTYGTNGYSIPRPTKVNLIDTTAIKRDILKAQQKHPDAIIVFLHWGRQYQNKPSSRQKRLVNFFHRNGVNIVIGSHPHVIQPVDYERDYIKSKDYFTAFSLGNFISNQRKFPRDGSLVLSLKFVKNKQGKLSLVYYDTLPVWVYKYRRHKQWHYEILPVEQFKLHPDFFVKNEDYQKMMRYYKHYLRLINP